ncbi:Bug family tripartite tricarboxylate transporter substrate binding protein [Casimicrobium huifangae]|uniref:Bug family tripartite tricarboxylate transporter substrate binding protein n=1 Tax=Casimicrobium huifangae TaxID=2591109 RepID=UPI0037849625
MMTIKRISHLLALGALCAVHSAPTFAQAYPSKPVTVVVPFSPGGGTDIGARLIAQKLTAKWGQSVIVENRAGAGGLVGADLVAKAKPDGYTLLVGNVGTQAINQSLYKMPYNADTAFAPISMIAELPFVMLAGPSVNAKTPKEFVALAKAEPGKRTYASSGQGGSPHLTAEIFQGAAGVKLTHVPYKGGGPAMTDLMAGHVDILFASVLEGSGHVKAGKLKALAVSSATRSPALPDVPTLAEAGIANSESGSWIAMFAPTGTPQAIVDKIAADIKEAVAQADTKQTLIGQGATPWSTTPSELKAIIERDRVRYGKVITDRSIKVE